MATHFHFRWIADNVEDRVQEVILSVFCYSELKILSFYKFYTLSPGTWTFKPRSTIIRYKWARIRNLFKIKVSKNMIKIILADIKVLYKNLVFLMNSLRIIMCILMISNTFWQIVVKWRQEKWHTLTEYRWRNDKITKILFVVNKIEKKSSMYITVIIILKFHLHYCNLAWNL